MGSDRDCPLRDKRNSCRSHESATVRNTVALRSATVAQTDRAFGYRFDGLPPILPPKPWFLHHFLKPQVLAFQEADLR
jgi:hypothetical protein